MQSADNVQAVAQQPVTLPYLLVMPIPVYCDAAGQRWLDALWLKDLLLHLTYLQDLTLACPCVHRAPPLGAMRVDDPRIRFLDLPDSRRQTTRLPETALALWRGVGQAAVVHHCIGDWWPLSMNYLAAAFAAWRGRVSVVVVESSGWRLVPGEKASVWRWLKAQMAEIWGRFYVNRASLAIFTQAQYLHSLLTRQPERGHVIHASWIDEENLRSEARCVEDGVTKGLSNPQPLRLLFAGRLTHAKGVAVLLKAFEAARPTHGRIELDIIGTGDCLAQCHTASLRSQSGHRLQVLDSVPYGPEFFALLRRYHAVVVPSETDEQPRIVYDAYAQGVPVLVSNTPGLLDCVEDGVTGRTFERGDAQALAHLFLWAQDHRAELQRMGLAGLERARKLTHRDMHARRHRLLLQCLAERGLIRGNPFTSS